MLARTPLAAVVAVGRNGAIGRDGGLPWTMPGDLARFRDLTMGTPMIMGRRTFESIGKALPGRESIVVTRDPALALPEGVLRTADPETALAIGRERARAIGAPAITLIGGATLFAAMMTRVDRLHLTVVDLAPDADTFFPTLDPAAWREVSRHVPPRHPRDEAACVFVDYERA
jgi:dihydrofolate reductase